MHEVFVNYRTGDGDKSAIVIERDLNNRFGEDTVFRAGTSIKSGEYYPQKLINGVRGSSVLLAVIGPNWVRHPALHNEDDWVRREIAEALRNGIPVIPILDGRRTERLRRGDLPRELAVLADHQSLPIDLQQDVRSSLERLADRIVERVPSLGAPPPDTAEAPGFVSNSAANVYGTAVQARDIAGDAGTVIKGNHGPLLTGKGILNDHRNSPHFSGDGATYVAGDNRGGIRHRFGGSRKDGSDNR
ncbi:toll/interleukin-1 receptor domain-containing protein [Streptosporangium saharense]|uniref:toll/interleukin-1 receptor domain-containing protein n=1 Tax=Streptosporangium saharense TaxID=1706840 RepID=UPI0036AF0170